MNKTLKDKIVRLKELAYCLPRGEWSVSGFDRKVVVTGAEKVVAIHADKNNLVLTASESEAAFIAATSPAMLTEVIAELEECERNFMYLATRVEIYDGHGDMPPVNAIYKAVFDRLLHLKAENERLLAEPRGGLAEAISSLVLCEGAVNEKKLAEKDAMIDWLVSKLQSYCDNPAIHN